MKTIAQKHQQEPYTYELNHELKGTSYSVRQNLADIVQRELVGPIRGEEEVLPFSPRSHYLVGLIAPLDVLAPEDKNETKIYEDQEEPTADPDDSEAIRSNLTGETPLDLSTLIHSRGVPAEADDISEPEEDDSDSEDRVPKQGLMLPSSMGLRFQIPQDQESFTITASWGTYKTLRAEPKDGSKGLSKYQRIPHEITKTIKVADLIPGATFETQLKDSVTLRIDLYKDAQNQRLLIEVALCNDEKVPAPIPMDKWMFQTHLRISAGGKSIFLPVRDILEHPDHETDEELSHLNLLYRNHLEYAIGRSCSADWHVKAGERRAYEVETTWIPTSETPQTRARSLEDVELSMDALAEASSQTLNTGLLPLASGYASWLKKQRVTAEDFPEHLQETAENSIEDAEAVLQRLEAGIQYLADNEQALTAFRFMNRVMSKQRKRSQVVALRSANSHMTVAEAEAEIEARGQSAASWRAFQLAFILLQLPALVEPDHPSRSDDVLASAELLFFPTGGGKTEAYLGLAAFTFAIRRLQGRVQTAEGDYLNGNDGVSVLMRYTLRLLTSQQFQRATTLMCAAELERQQDPDTWGQVPFRIGLWVGSAVSPKTYKDAKDQIDEAKQFTGEGARNRLTVLQAQRCPWCGEKIGASQVKAKDDEHRILVYCSAKRGRCPFAEVKGQDREGLPVLTVDEEIYAYPPAFVIATVDKFSRLAREGQASSLFGYVSRQCPTHGYQHPDSNERCKGKRHNASGNKSAVSVRPVERLRPPDLIIQDELHLITGALGTAVGLFETGIDLMSTWTTAQGKTVRPLIVASTATVRNAENQIRAIYGRKTSIFPPQVLDVADTYFSEEIPVSEQDPGRLYMGICAQGARLSTSEIRVAEILLSASKLLYNRNVAAGPENGTPEAEDYNYNAADPYMTLVSYFNSTRELAGMSRYMAGDIYTRLIKPRKSSGFVSRYGSDGGTPYVGELTSRIASSQIGKTLDDLALEFKPDYDTTEAAQRRSYLGEENKRLQKQGNPPVEIPARGSASPFDVVLATSMLQVGVDVQRLGLMMVVGQPKNTAEYIQASSRVGRDSSKPGLVVSLHNWARPRDLAHFEQFKHYHATFYANVEALSVTPYSLTSIERGIDGLIVSLARVLDATTQEKGLSSESGAKHVETRSDFLDDLTQKIYNRCKNAALQEYELRAIKEILENRVQRWKQRNRYVQDRHNELVYERVGESKSKLALILSPESTLVDRANSNQPPFVIANSMREVQPEINLLVSPIDENLYSKPIHDKNFQWTLPKKEKKND